MNFCILITLSRQTISFRYYRDDDTRRFRPLMTDANHENDVLPLAVLCNGDKFVIGSAAREACQDGNQSAFDNIFEVSVENREFYYKGNYYNTNRLLLMAIEDNINRLFFNNTMYRLKGDLEENRSTMPIVVVLDTDITRDQKWFINTQLKEAGYGNYEILDYNPNLVGALRKNGSLDINAEYSAVVVNDGLNVRLDVLDANGVIKFQNVLENIGKDPRIALAADCIWNSITDSYYLDRKKEEDVLLATAKKFIDSNSYELNDYIELSDGNKYSFFVSLHDITANNNHNTIIDAVCDILNKRSISPKKCNLILRGKYFQGCQTGQRFAKKCVIGEDGDQLVCESVLDFVEQQGFKLKIEQSNPPKPPNPEISQPPTKSEPATPMQPTPAPSIPSRRIIREKIYAAKRYLNNGDMESAQQIYDEIAKYSKQYPEIDEVKELLSKPEISDGELVETMKSIRQLIAVKKYDDAINYAQKLLSQLPKNSPRLDKVNELLVKAKDRKNKQ